jgi:hypothetical protein
MRSLLVALSLVAAAACGASSSSDPDAGGDDGDDGDDGNPPDAEPPPIDALPPGEHLLVDTLRNGTTLGNPVGGAFGPDGWTVTSRTDRMWFALPRLASGSIELTVTNMSNANLIAADNELLAMYEAGWSTEPVPYSPDFRNNHYKTMLRIYGEEEIGRVGQQKLMWGLCPSGQPGYDACGCASFFEEPFGGDGTWTGAPEQLRIEWGNGVTRFLRNGGEVLAIDWAASGLAFGPNTLHFSIGTSRPDAVGTAAMPVGATFSDLTIQGTEGAVAACPQ